MRPVVSPVGTPRAPYGAVCAPMEIFSTVSSTLASLAAATACLRFSSSRNFADSDTSVSAASSACGTRTTDGLARVSRSRGGAWARGYNGDGTFRSREE